MPLRGETHYGSMRSTTARRYAGTPTTLLTWPTEKSRSEPLFQQGRPVVALGKWKPVMRVRCWPKAAGRRMPQDAFKALHTRNGRGSTQLASAGVGGADRTWTMKQELKTPNYTTCWKDLPRARA